AGQSGSARYAQLPQTLCGFRVVLRYVWKVQFIALRIEQQHRNSAGVQCLAALRNDQRDELFESELGGEHTAQFIDERFARAVVIHHLLSSSSSALASFRSAVSKPSVNQS